MAPETPKKIAIAAAVGGGGLLAFAALRRVRFKKIQAVRKKKASEPAEYQSTAPSGGSPGVTLNPSGAIWMIQPATIKPAAQLFLANGLKKTISVGKAGLIRASVINNALELSRTPSNPGLLGSLVSWGLAMQSWQVDRMARLRQFTAFDFSETGVGKLLFDGKTGQPKTSKRLYNTGLVVTGNSLPNLNYLVGWPAAPGMVWASAVPESRYDHPGFGIRRPQFGTPANAGVLEFLSKKYWLDNYGYDGEGRSKSQAVIWRDSWVGRSFQFDKYPYKKTMGDVGEISLGDRHSKPSDFDTAFLGAKGTKWGAWDGYFRRCQWLVWSAEWYRLTEPFRYTWMLGKIPKFPEAPVWWRDHCLSWGIGVADQWRWEHFYHPAWDGMVPPPGTWKGLTGDLLKQVMEWTPRPGSVRSSRIDTSLEYVGRFPAVDWPLSTGSMQPAWLLPVGYAALIKGQRSAKAQQRFERMKTVANLVASVAKTFMGDTTLVEKALDAAEDVVDALNKLGLSTGPLMPLFSVARTFVGKDLSLDDAFSINPALMVTDAMAYLEQGLESEAEKALNNLKGTISNIDKEWPHTASLIGQFQDLSGNMRRQYMSLYGE